MGREKKRSLRCGPGTAGFFSSISAAGSALSHAAVPFPRAYFSSAAFRRRLASICTILNFEQLGLAVRCNCWEFSACREGPRGSFFEQLTGGLFRRARVLERID